MPHRFPTRRRTLIAAAALLAGGATRTASAQTLIPLRFGSTPLVDGVPAVRAVSSGAFRAAGLDVSVLKMGNSTAIGAAIIGGAIDFGTVSPGPIINAREHDVPLGILGNDRVHLVGRPFANAIVAAANGPIQSLRDLNGKTVSVAAVRDSSWVAARALIDAKGGDSSTVKFIEIPFSAVAAAIETGRIDAGVVVEPFLSEGRNTGKVRDLGDLFAYAGTNIAEMCYATSRASFERNRDAMQRFQRVIRETQQWLNAHRDEAAEIALTYTGASRAALAPETINYAVDHDPRVVQPWVAGYLKYGLIQKSYNAAELYLTR
jgi:NitT/TauT family transport system substrate-binding protein